VRYGELEQGTERGGVQNNRDDLFSLDRYSPARGAAHIESEKCRERPKAEECVPGHKDKEEFLVLRANALPDPYRTVSVKPKRTSLEGYQRTHKDNDDRISTHTTPPS
jgi:hypothetical protein